MWSYLDQKALDFPYPVTVDEQLPTGPQPASLTFAMHRTLDHICNADFSKLQNVKE